MSQDSDNIGGTLRDIGENLGSIFRFLLPGVLIIGATYSAYPTKISWPKLSDPWEILVLGIVALAAGNTWFVFNRYGVHQIVDWLLYRLGSDGPAKQNAMLAGSRNYIDVLGRFVRDSSLILDEMKALRHHVGFRASSVLLMYIVGELAIVFSFLNEGPGNFLYENAWPIRIVGLLALSVGFWQNVITRRIDWYTVYPPKRNDKPAPGTSK
jgi:hypothetical protein